MIIINKVIDGERQKLIRPSSDGKKYIGFLLPRKKFSITLRDIDRSSVQYDVRDILKCASQ